MDGKTARGASSPANPALQRPDPLSQTRAVVSSSSHMVAHSPKVEATVQGKHKESRFGLFGNQLTRAQILENKK